MAVHFILTKGELTPQYRRAIESAEVHDAPIILWYTGEQPQWTGWRNVDIEARKIDVPFWLQDELGCVIYDWLAYKIGYEEGGMLLGLDTYSIRPALGLLGDKEVVLSRDVPDDVEIEHPYNNIFICQQGSEIVRDMMTEAKMRILKGDMAWGDTGPAMLTQYALASPDKVAGVPFPALCGWEGSYIWKFYCGVAVPDPKTCVIHLFSSAYPELYRQNRIDLWIEHHPEFAWVQEYATAYPYVDPKIWQPPARPANQGILR